MRSCYDCYFNLSFCGYIGWNFNIDRDTGAGIGCFCLWLAAASCTALTNNTVNGRDVESLFEALGVPSAPYTLVESSSREREEITTSESSSESANIETKQVLAHCLVRGYGTMEAQLKERQMVDFAGMLPSPNK